MNNKQREMIFELLTGILLSQEIIVQTLNKSGAIRKQDVMEGLDYFIDHFEKRGARQKITMPMRYLRKNLEKPYPEFHASPKIRPAQSYPHWFQGVIQGGVPRSSESKKKE